MNNPDEARHPNLNGSHTGSAAPGPRENPEDDAAWQNWLASPAGQYLLRWEAAELDRAVANVFGYYAVQLGTPVLDALQASRMPHRIRVKAGLAKEGDPGWRADLHVADFRQLPFDTHAIDLVVLAHQLELCPDPYQLLREVDRVLRPDGHLIVAGLNPWSLWGARQRVPAWLMRRFMPAHGPWMAASRLRDWMRLLSFEPEATVHGCYAWPFRRREWLMRSSRMLETAGDRWWPVCGAAYLVKAVKQVRGMHLVGPAWRRVPVRNGGVATAGGQRNLSCTPVSALEAALGRPVSEGDPSRVSTPGDPVGAGTPGQGNPG